MSLDLLINAILAGLLIGGFYAAVTVGISISFGILDIVNIAHPAFVILGSYIAYIVNDRLGIDPILTSIIALPAFYALGAMVYQVYYQSFEKRGQDAWCSASTIEAFKPPTSNTLGTSALSTFRSGSWFRASSRC